MQNPLKAMQKYKENDLCMKMGGTERDWNPRVRIDDRMRLCCGVSSCIWVGPTQPLLV